MYRTSKDALKAPQLHEIMDSWPDEYAEDEAIIAHFRKVASGTYDHIRSESPKEDLCLSSK